MIKIKLPFGLNEKGELVHISEVPSGKSNCICPRCAGQLIARKGSKNTHHFAHVTEECQSGFETGLHLFAKSVLEKNKKLKLPEVFLTYSMPIRYILPADNYKFNSFTRTIATERYIEFDRIELEKSLGIFIPDIMLYKDNKPLIIEIKVTHAIDDIKYEKIKSSGISTLEIDLSKIADDFYRFDRSQIEDALINNTNNKFWIYNIWIEKLEQGIQKEIEKEKLRLKQEFEKNYSHNSIL